MFYSADARFELLSDIDRLHTTELGVLRIRRNLGLNDDTDAVLRCREIILDKNSAVERKGKNYYVSFPGGIITVNAGSMTIITAKKI
ncbi:MAG: DUF3781 domain-containing protein [Methanomicrobium sp.]|nr:DUF3781 domain-containing protein [Methanomicrobium sp.]